MKNKTAFGALNVKASFWFKDFFFCNHENLLIYSRRTSNAEFLCEKHFFREKALNKDESGNF